MTTRPRYDVAIVGGGMVGAVLAVALSEADFHVALVEAKQPKSLDPEAGYDLRQSAIAPGPRRLLENLGLWDRLPDNRICPFTGMKVWQADQDDELFLEHTAVGLPELGHIVENALVVDAAWQAFERVDVYCPAKMAALNVEAQAARLTLDDEQEITAALVVGAEGANSPVREAAGITTTGWGYGQRCTVGTVTPERHHRHIAWQRFTETGPVAFLPLADGRCSLAWHADDALADELAELDDDEFCRRLTEASGGVLGRIQHMGTRAAFPLKLMHAREYVQPRVAIAGDAAHVVHPMAGQGVNLGLLDVAELVAALEAGRAAGADAGEITYLKRYQRARMADNMMMLAATDGLKRLYGSHNPLLRSLRGLAISGASRLAPIRQIMISQAVGLSNDGPRLLR
ncbi:UbiH/UbiF/VisC/COQ6 family ubiquinone biosynthesis hydroxylase [Salinisphaera hydrothermalis]|uniref:UbiH/UbiF/VisC/COQ6 family Ubiquinone biosynthesis hydroxylase n=1 Tax=Salinisphaera hydrothermalis (strain C41B8) TaxID=1304275 RepID=A0A084ILH3_SALHC|nr:UbiH/UbiF/VisC/COQ6 family ubiquinone biosynthesis hydroxylase [Salinisphaera hydrothermalis]KEZ77557.1 UbiH/UbiF/VisC/COQ6 family Ubiquinone biosynthesis hydroxylase [Salinisphaera hydrothermalis C41B8]